MYYLDQIKQRIIDTINRLEPAASASVSDLLYPPQPEMGDLSLPCFKLAKALGKGQAEIMAAFVAQKSEFGPAVATISAAGAYLNFKLDTAALATSLINEIGIRAGSYGHNEAEKQKRIVVEYSNGNTHKETHVGHLRNICYGDSVQRILKANGHEAIPVSYINDFGIHVAKTLWAYLAFYKDAPLPDNKGAFLGQVYVRSGQELEKDQTAKGQVEFMMKKIEARQGEEYALWEKTRQWTIAQLEAIYKELGVEFDHVFYESEYIDDGKKLIPELVKKGILKDSQGAVIADLEEYKLGVLVVVRSDGTATYPVADLPLAVAKYERYNYDSSIYVVDVRQALYFKQLFKILELMGQRTELVHLGYDFVKLPSGMMSSRTGNVVTYEELKDELLAKAKKETAERHQDWSEAEIDDTAMTLAVAAIKYEMLKTGATQEIVFDIARSLSFQGNTAAYVLYTYARLNTIVSKSREDGAEAPLTPGRLNEPVEHRLLIKLAQFPETVARAGQEYDPSEIVKYLFTLAQMSNDYYHQVPVLKAEETTRLSRLALLRAINQILANGLSVLGIKTLDRM
jgi:arginyl-tRNA synthetase